VVLEADLDYLVGEAEHYGMLCTHPLLNINDRLTLAPIWAASFVLHLYVALHICGLSASRPILTRSSVLWTIFEIRPEMLKKGHFLLELLGEVEE
jgi:hypothetical protein